MSEIKFKAGGTVDMSPTTSISTEIGVESHSGPNVQSLKLSHLNPFQDQNYYTHTLK